MVVWLGTETHLSHDPSIESRHSCRGRELMPCIGGGELVGMVSTGVGPEVTTKEVWLDIVCRTLMEEIVLSPHLFLSLSIDGSAS